MICGVEDGYFPEEAYIVGKVSKAAPDVLLVALGAPAQEAFIARNRQQLGAKVCIGVGGLFDFYSGRMPRAPQWLREAGLEWDCRPSPGQNETGQYRYGCLAISEGSLRQIARSFEIERVLFQARLKRSSGAA